MGFVGFDFNVSVLVYPGYMAGLLVLGCEREVAYDRCDISFNTFEMCGWLSGRKVILPVFCCCMVDAACEVSSYQWVEFSVKMSKGAWYGNEVMV